MRSLRRTLAVRYGGTMLVALAGIALGTYEGIRRMAQRELDETLRWSAPLQLDIITAFGTPAPHAGSDTPAQFALGTFRVVTLRDSTGRVQAQNTLLTPPLRLNRAAFESARRGQTVLTDESWNGARVRSIHLPAPRANGAAVLEITTSTRPLEHELARLRLQLLGAVMLASLATFLGADRLAASTLRPLQDIVRQAAAVTGFRQGERIAVTTHVEECASLVNVLNGMLNRLERAHTWHRRVMRDLGHDLRTPITALQSGVEVALWTTRTPDEYRRVLGGTLEEIERLTLISDALILLGRLEFGDAVVERAPLDLRTAVADGVARAQHRMGDHILVPDIGEAPITVLADRRLVGLALDHLFDNALQHTPPGTRIHASVRATEGVGEFVVEDDGPGVPDETLVHIFEQFYRGDSARNRDGGPGLGLTLVSAIVARHDGTVRAERRSGGGLRIRIRIPLAAPANKADLPDASSSDAEWRAGGLRHGTGTSSREGDFGSASASLHAPRTTSTP